MPRPQLNFRLDADLLTAIKAKCEADGITITDFIVNACRSALGIETMEPTYPSSDALESLLARLANMELRLDDCLTSKERVDRIEQRVESVLGEMPA